MVAARGIAVIVLAASAGIGSSVLGASDERLREVGSHYERATGFVAEGESVSAVIELKNALQIDPDHLPSLVLMGEVFLDEQLGDAAEQTFREALQLGADPARVGLLLGRSLLAQRKSRELIEELQPALYDPLTRVEIYSLRAGAHLLNSDVADAQRELDASRSVAPAALSTRLLQLSIHVANGELDAAERLASAVITEAPDESKAWQGAASAAHARGDVEAALQRYDRAVALDDGNGDARLGRLSILVDTARDDRSGDDLEFFAVNFPNEPRANYLRGLKLARGGDADGARRELSKTTYFLSQFDDGILQERNRALLSIGALAHFGLGQYTQAGQYANRFLQVEPDDVGVRRLLAETLLLQQRPDDALKVLRPALDTAPDDLALLALAGRAHALLGEYRQSSEYVERAIRVHGARPSLSSRQATMQIVQGDVEQGIGALRRLVDEQPEGRAGLPLVLALLQNGESAEAVAVSELLVEREPENPTLLNLLAVAQFRSGDLEAAQRSLQRCLEVVPGFLAAEVNAGKIQVALGNSAAAETIFARLGQSHADNSRVFLEWSRAAEARGSSRDAAKHAENARRLARDDIGALRQVVELKLAEGDLEGARQEASRGISGARESVEVLELQAKVRLASDNSGGARATLRKMAQTAGYDVEWLMRTAAYQADNGFADDAAYTLYRAIQADPNNVAAHLGLIEQRLLQDLLEPAYESAQTAAGRFPEDARVHLLMGEVEFARGNLQPALAAFDRALRFEPLSLAVIRGAHVLARMGKPELATKRLRGWLAGRPDDDGVRLALADGLISLADYPGAVEAYEPLLDRQSVLPRVLNNLAFAMYKAGDPRAETFARRAVAAAPGSAAANDTLGWILLEDGRAEESLAYLREASTRAWNDPEVRFHLAVCLARLGRPQEAKVELAAALERDADFDGRSAAAELLESLANTN